ncbi:uncharacterized protein LOC135327989 [Dromaius novaehollandiae]|uniref:uncharacterized protein LOC135327989 n=1 Tax=Dromaius novaehollandiae TaxID=8790 RepID=UPI00311E8FB8
MGPRRRAVRRGTLGVVVRLAQPAPARSSREPGVPPRQGRNLRKRPPCRKTPRGPEAWAPRCPRGEAPRRGRGRWVLLRVPAAVGRAPETSLHLLEDVCGGNSDRLSGLSPESQVLPREGSGPRPFPLDPLGWRPHDRQSLANVCILGMLKPFEKKCDGLEGLVMWLNIYSETLPISLTSRYLYTIRQNCGGKNKVLHAAETAVLALEETCIRTNGYKTRKLQQQGWEDQNCQDALIHWEGECDSFTKL